MPKTTDQSFSQVVSVTLWNEWLIGDSHSQANPYVDFAALDLSKAYNRVWTPGVLQQLIKWGITGKNSSKVSSETEHSR